MSKIPTAEEFLVRMKKMQMPISEIMKGFTKRHVKAALEAADCNAEVTPIDHEEISEGSFRPIYGVDSSSILNAYPLENIK